MLPLDIRKQPTHQARPWANPSIDSRHAGRPGHAVPPIKNFHLARAAAQNNTTTNSATSSSRPAPRVNQSNRHSGPTPLADRFKVSPPSGVQQREAQRLIGKSYDATETEEYSVSLPSGEFHKDQHTSGLWFMSLDEVKKGNNALIRRDSRKNLKNDKKQKLTGSWRWTLWTLFLMILQVIVCVFSALIVYIFWEAAGVDLSPADVEKKTIVKTVKIASKFIIFINYLIK